MSLTEQKNRIRNSLEEMLSYQFDSVDVNGKRGFQKTDGTIFIVSSFPGEDAVVVEYADTFADAQKNLFEDGDRFYLSGITTEQLYRQILEEVGR